LGAGLGPTRPGSLHALLHDVLGPGFDGSGANGQPLGAEIGVRHAGGIGAEGLRELRIEKGNAWIWKPSASSVDGRLSFGWGGDVLVTDKGGERLFTRPHGLVSVT
jgi:hypothetical protein